MNIFKILFSIACALTLFSCSKENPFEGTKDEPGQISKSAISIDLKDSEMLMTRAVDYNVDDFVITFTKVGSSTTAARYRLGDMPDLVTLEKGNYIAKAEYGEDIDAEWNAPYYTGTSQEFTIEAGKITDDIGDISCTLQNVKVSVEFAPLLTQNMSDDAFVEVRVTQNGKDEGKYLRFTKSDQTRGNSGYYHHAEGVSLVATFRGVVEGLQTVETKSYAIVNKGYHYKITFKLRSSTGESDGDATGDLDVDASVTVTDVERNVNVEEDELLDDDERPKEEDPDDPNKPDVPDNPTEKGPKIVAEAPIDLDKVNKVNADSHVALNITSETGITEFKVNIISNAISALGIVPEVLDLVDPGENLNFISELGLLESGKTTVRGEKEVKFDVSGFMVMLASLQGDKDHTFRLTVSDASGTVVKDLRLNTGE